MIDWNRVGPLLAVALAGAAVAGAVLIISLDFASAEGVGGPRADQLKDVTSISLFVKVEVPGSDLQVHTGIEYADAVAMFAGRPDHRWCYVVRGTNGSAFSPHINLGTQAGDRPPVYTNADVTADQARSFGLTVDQLDTIAHRDCRFGGKGERL